MADVGEAIAAVKAHQKSTVALGTAWGTPSENFYEVAQDRLNSVSSTFSDLEFACGLLGDVLESGVRLDDLLQELRSSVAEQAKAIHETVKDNAEFARSTVSASDVRPAVRDVEPRRTQQAIKALVGLGRALSQERDHLNDQLGQIPIVESSPSTAA